MMVGHLFNRHPIGLDLRPLMSIEQNTALGPHLQTLSKHKCPDPIRQSQHTPNRTGVTKKKKKRRGGTQTSGYLTTIGTLVGLFINQEYHHFTNLKDIISCDFLSITSDQRTIEETDRIKTPPNGTICHGRSFTSQPPYLGHLATRWINTTNSSSR